VSDLSLPTGWVEATLSHVAFIEMGQSPDSRTYNTEGNGLPFFQGKAEFQAVFPEIRKWCSEPTKIVERGDILLSIRAPVGPTNIAPERSCIGRGLAGVRADVGINQSYLFYYFRNIEPWLSKQGTGSTFSAISGQFVRAITVPIPPFNEQIRIVAKLEELLTELDAGIAELKAAQKKLVQYRQSLLKAAVEGALTANWRKNNYPAESGAQLLERILVGRRAQWEDKQQAKYVEQGKKVPKDWQKKYPEPVQPDATNLPELPEGWKWASLDMLGEIASGVAKGSKRNNSIVVREVPYLRVANVQRGYLDLAEVKSILATEREIAELTLQDGDVLFNEGGDRDKLGRGWVWRNQVAECIHQNHVFRMRPYIEAIQSELISHHGNTFGKLWFQKMGKQTTNLASINMTMLRMFPVPVAPAAEQQEILEQIRSQLEILSNQEHSIELALKQSVGQRQNILSAAFSGMLVPQDMNDEPAGVLLDLIRAKRAEQAQQPKLRKNKKQKEIVTLARKLVDVLTEAVDWLPAQEAFRRCGVSDGAQTEEIEALYAELRTLDKNGRLLVDVFTDEQGRKIADHLKLVG